MVTVHQSRFALELHNKADSTAEQMKQCLAMIRKPDVDAERARRVWEQHVYSQRDAYKMPS